MVVWIPSSFHTAPTLGEHQAQNYRQNSILTFLFKEISLLMSVGAGYIDITESSNLLGNTNINANYNLRFLLICELSLSCECMFIVEIYVPHYFFFSFGLPILSARYLSGAAVVCCPSSLSAFCLSVFNLVLFRILLLG